MPTPTATQSSPGGPAAYIDQQRIERAASSIVGLTDPGIIFLQLRGSGLPTTGIGAHLANIMDAAGRQAVRA